MIPGGTFDDVAHLAHLARPEAEADLARGRDEWRP